jgi:hypothetical protein
MMQHMKYTKMLRHLKYKRMMRHCKYAKIIFSITVLMGLLYAYTLRFHSDFYFILNLMRLSLPVLLLLLFVTFVTYLNYYVKMKHGASYREGFMEYPLRLIGALFVFFVLAEISFDAIQSSK